MDVYIYQEKSRRVKGEDETFLSPIGVLEGFENEDAALEALLDAEPSFMGVELVIFTQEPQYITAEEPTTKYAFSRRNGSGAVVEEEPEAEVEPEEDEEPEAPAPVAKRRPGAKAAAKKPPAKKPAAKKRPATRAGTRAGSSGGRRSPFTRNEKSAE